MENDFHLETQFTREQLERLSELASKAHWSAPTPDSHNLLRKLTEYVADANFRQRLRRTG